MDASCTIQDSIHVFSLVHKYVSSILGTYQSPEKALTLFFKYVFYRSLISELGMRNLPLFQSNSYPKAVYTESDDAEEKPFNPLQE